ncbi:MAG: FAD-dependent oxidoreductase [Nitrospinae bacterium]|nr:FAD-dependent oxidoreductase [Nitrospinota bacterium]
MSGYVVPLWENKTAPCGGLNGCPANTDIAAALHALSRNEPGKAWRIMMDSHPLRGVLGRVCYGFCETPCNRGKFDQAISIQMLESVIGDHGFDPSYRPAMAARNGKKVLIVGAGPAGLAAGWFLNLAGYKVDIHEADEKAGGVLRYGIPQYRLPREALDREIGLIEACGVEIKTGKKTTPADVKKLLVNGYHAAIVATGAGNGRKAGITGEDKTLNGIEFLRAVNTGKTGPNHFTGKKVVVIGGGNVAMDACRCATRLGAVSVNTLYRRTENEMPAHANEVKQAREEGVVFEFLVAPESYDGKVLKSRKMRLSGDDESGRGKPVPTGEVITTPADVVIMAIGQEPEKWEMTGVSNVFFAGDVLPDSRGTVIHSIAAGKKTAEGVHKLLSGASMFAPSGEEVTYDKMNVKRYFVESARIRNRTAPAKKRIAGFEVIEQVVTLEEGILESNRCFRCGMCIGGLNSDCDWCFRACGDKKGIEKAMVEWTPEGKLFSRGDDCDYCGRCWEDCPRYVVRPVEVEEVE